MRYVIFVAILVLVYVVCAYARIQYQYKHANNPSIKQTGSTLGAGPELRYIAAGDSTAVGEGASSVEQTYAYNIAKSLSSRYNVTYENIAKGGAKTEDVIATQLEKIIAFNPDVVTISVGANDATHLRSSQSILRNYKTIIDTLTEKTHAKIYITNIANFYGATLLPAWYIQLIEQRSAKLNPEILKLNNGNDRVHIIDIHDFGWSNYPDRALTYSLDHFHPSDLGYQNWANAFLCRMD